MAKFGFKALNCFLQYIWSNRYYPTFNNYFQVTNIEGCVRISYILNVPMQSSHAVSDPESKVFNLFHFLFSFPNLTQLFFYQTVLRTNQMVAVFSEVLHHPA